MMAEVSEPLASSDAVTAAEERVGKPINAKWTIDCLLGVGGMGAVFAATHRNGSRAALKVLYLDLARDQAVRDRFLREARIANRVDHPARVAVLDDDVSTAGEPFLVMELLEGETLEQKLNRVGGRIAVEETFRIFDTVLDLLARCHEVGIVHRDIKPANVFLTTAGHVKVLDFGVARMRGPHPGAEATRDGTALGTPSFMAPEQALGLGELVDARADLWSVGACIYTALSGTRLHQARTHAESFVLAATQAAPSLARVAPELPPEIVAFVDKSLAFDRTRRFQDATSMRAEMGTLLAALRTGQLGAPSARRAAALVVHGEDTGDGDDEVDGVQARTQVVLRIESVWRQIAQCMAAVRQYGWTHAMTAKALRASHEELVDALARGPVRWEVGPNGFTYEDVPVWTPDRAPYDRIPFQLFADGVRRVALKPGMTESELRDFVAILLRDVSLGVAADDDAVTALWDRRFEHVAYLAVDSFADGEDAADFQEECDEVAGKARTLARIDRDWDQDSPEERALRVTLASVLRETGEAAAALAIDPLTRATLGAQIGLDPDRWTERYVDAFAEAWLEALDQGDAAVLTGALEEWVRDQLALRSYAPAFRMIDGLRKAFAALTDEPPDRALDPAIVRAMFPLETIRTIVTDLATEARASRGVSVDPVVVAGIETALEDIDGDAFFEVACQCFDAFEPDGLGGVLLRFVKRWAAGREAELAAALPKAGPQAALATMALLLELGTPAALAGLEAALENPHVEVRVEALARLPDVSDDRMREELRKLLEGLDPTARIEVLRLVARKGLVAAGPVLTRRVQQPSFHALGKAERRAWLEAVIALNPRRGEGLVIELLTKAPIITSDPVEETRILAAEMLAEHPSPEGLKAAHEASKRRFWNTARLREAAARAAAEIAARLGTPLDTGERDGRAPVTEGKTS